MATISRTLQQHRKNFHCHANSYVPLFIFTFLLLARVNSKYAVPVAVLLTTLALTYGILNLYAGLNNLNLIRDFINWKIN